MSEKIKNVRYALVAMLLFFAAAVQAQSISGSVKDASGTPVIGATIMEHGTQNGTVTDFDGKFTIKLQKSGNLDISYVGMKPASVPTKGKTTLNVTLEEDNTTLNDVVVVGYGTMKRKDLTGSVASVTGETLTKNPVANVTEALQGKLGGVNIIAQDGRPGGEMAIRVRGGGSITQSNEPLIIVDGIAVSSLDDIPADNIESIDVLKDASSTAIYGARGANGVILVTTKQAKEGKAQIRYNVYYQSKAKPEIQDVQDAYTAVRRLWEEQTAAGYGDAIAKYYGLGSAYGNHLNDYKNVAVHNHMEDIIKTGNMWNHDFSISGGTSSTKYYVSANYIKDNSTFEGSGYNRWNINMKLMQKLAKTLTLNLDARYTENKLQLNRFYSGSHSNNTLVYPWMYASINKDDIMGDKDPANLGEGSLYSDPLYDPAAVVADNDYTRKSQRIRLNSALTWTPIKGLTAKTELGLSRNWSETESWNGRNTGKNYGTSTASLTKGNGYNLNWTTTLNYDFSEIIKNENHSVSLLLGNEVLANRSNSMNITGVGFSEGWDKDLAFGQINMGKELTSNKFSNTIGTPSHTTSWFGRANYNLLGRYMFTATLRADGSSKFAEGNKWGYFPAGAIAWRISDEPFMKSTQNWLDNLKLRLSIGTSGNDGINANAFIDAWTIKQSSVDGSYSYAMGDLKGNPDLTWEKTTSRNVGLDYSFLNGKFNGSIDFYWNTTSDCLMRVPINGATGFAYQFQNVAKTSNKGIEFAFNYNIIRSKDFDLNFGLTYNYNVNKVEKVTSANMGVGPTYASTALYPADCYKVVEGEPVGLVYGFKSAGFYRVEDFDYDSNTKVWTLKPGVKDSSTKLSSYEGSGNYQRPAGQNAFPGMPKYEDVDGNNIVDENDQTVIGRMPAKHTGGFNISGRYHNFDFSMNFAYQLDGKVFNANYARSVFSGQANKWASMSRLASKFDNSWKMYDIDANGNMVVVTEPDKLAALNTGAQYGVIGYTASNAIVSDDYIESAAFLRMQSLTIGYTIPKNIVKKVGLSNARFYFTAGNLFIIKAYDGLDPDISTDGAMSSSYAGFPTPGYDYNAYPRSRTFTFGLNVAF